MSNEFWFGFYNGFIAAALPLLAFMAWDANRRVQAWIDIVKENGDVR